LLGIALKYIIPRTIQRDTKQSTFSKEALKENVSLVKRNVFFNTPGLVSEVLMRKKELEVLANLKNIVILDCNKDALYKKVHPASG